MKKRIGALLVLPLIAGALTGCNNGGSSSGGIKIKWWHTYGQTIVDGLKPKIKAFVKAVKENDGVDVSVEMTYQGSYDDIATKIANGYSVGNKPTIAVAYPDNVADYIEISKSAGDNFVVNLEKYIDDPVVGFGKEAWLGDEYDETDFIEDFYAEGSRYSIKGTYSLPYMKSTEIMFYNLTLVRKIMAGVHKGGAGDFDGFDETIGSSDVKIKQFMSNLSWDRFMELNAFIKTNMSKIGNNLELPAFYDSDGNLLISKIFQNKIGYASITSSGVGHIDFEDDPDRTALRTLLGDLGDYYKAGLFTTKGIKGTYGSDYFTGESCVFSIGSSGGSGYNFPQGASFDLGVCRVPHSNNNALYVTQGPTLAMFSDNGLSAERNEQTMLYAWKFMKYITNGQINAELCVNGSEGYVPVRTSAYETQFYQEFLAEEDDEYAKCARVVLDINNNAKYLVSPAFKGSAELRDQCGSLLTAAIKANKTEIDGLIQTAIDNAYLKF